MGAPTSMGSFVSTANVTTSGALALSVGASVGDIVFVSIVGGSASIGAGVTDTKSNTWVQVSQAIAASGAAGTATGFYTIVTVAITTGDTITVTRTPTGSLTAHIMLITGQSPAQLGNSNSTPTNNSVTAQTAMTSGSVTVNTGDVVFQITMMGTGYGTVTPLASPAFTTFVTVDSTGGSNPRGTNVEYRVITAGATFTPQITVASGKAYSAVAVVFAALAAPTPGTVAAVAAIATPTVGGGPMPATVAAAAGIGTVVVSTFRHPTLLGVGDSTTYRSGSTASPPSREATTRAVMAAGGFESGAFYWYGVGGKSMTGTDSGGKTTPQNITDAVAVLGTPIDLGYAGLATNDVGSSDATFTADLNTVLDALEAAVTRTYWINLAFYSAVNTNAAHSNPIIAAQIALRTKVVYCDFNTYIHQVGVYDPLDWIFPTDSTHMTAQGWAKRDAYILAQLQGIPDPATVVAAAAIPGPAAFQVTTATVAGVAAVPAVVVGSSPTPATVAAVAGVPTVVFTSSLTRAPATVTAVAAVPAPTVTLPATIVPATVTATAAVPAPAAIGSTLAPGTVAAVAAVPAPITRASSTVTLATVAGVVAVPAVTVLTSAANPVATVAAIARVPAVAAVTTAYERPAPTGSWGTLLAILDEVRDIARQESTRTPIACPNDGEPLLSGPHGGLYCPWGDYQHAMAHPPGW